jgi:phosphoribosylcarboxyaminoimidazole (NCAIR) mutase
VSSDFSNATIAVSPLVGIIMGSSSDLETMRPAADILDEFGVAHEVRVVSAHRSPLRMVDYARTARERGLQVIIAGAGGAANAGLMALRMLALADDELAHRLTEHQAGLERYALDQDAALDR